MTDVDVSDPKLFVPYIDAAVRKLRRGASDTKDVLLGFPHPRNDTFPRLLEEGGRWLRLQLARFGLLEDDEIDFPVLLTSRKDSLGVIKYLKERGGTNYDVRLKFMEEYNVDATKWSTFFIEQERDRQRSTRRS
jgi:hypothetical protein